MTALYGEVEATHIAPDPSEAADQAAWDDWADQGYPDDKPDHWSGMDTVEEWEGWK